MICPREKGRRRAVYGEGSKEGDSVIKSDEVKVIDGNMGRGRKEVIELKWEKIGTAKL